MLRKAALEGLADEVRGALGRGAVDVPDDLGWTALHDAMLSGAGCLEVLTVLLCDMTADVNAATHDGLTPLHMCHEADCKTDWKAHRGRTADGRSSFYAAAVIQLLVDSGARVNAKAVDGSTPLHLAAEAGASASVMALLHCGAHPQLA